MNTQDIIDRYGLLPAEEIELLRRIWVTGYYDGMRTNYPWDDEVWIERYPNVVRRLRAVDFFKHELYIEARRDAERDRIEIWGDKW